MIMERCLGNVDSLNQQGVAQRYLHGKHPESQHLIDWTSPNNIPMAPDTFDMLFEMLSKHSKNQTKYMKLIVL